MYINILEATKGSRELDARIALKIHFPEYLFPDSILNKVPLGYIEAFVGLNRVHFNAGILLPSYTTKMDDAVLIIPKGYKLVLIVGSWENVQNKYVVTIRGDVGQNCFRNWQGEASTISLAICKSALRSRFK